MCECPIQVQPSTAYNQGTTQSVLFPSANTTKTPCASVQSKCNHPQHSPSTSHSVLFPSANTTKTPCASVQSKCNNPQHNQCTTQSVLSPCQYNKDAPGCPIQVQPSTAVNQCTTKAQHNPCCVHVYMFACLHVYRLQGTPPAPSCRTP
jgi:hypothetical protein